MSFSSSEASVSLPAAPASSRPPRSVIIGLAIAVLLDTVVQLCWKLAARGAPEAASAWQTLGLVIHQPLFHLTALLWVCEFCNWILVLSKSDMSYATPITSLSYVTVALGSFLFLGERIPPLRMGGIAVILLGVWYLSGSGHRTVRSPRQRLPAGEGIEMPPGPGGRA